ncbi:hypothetical protein ACTXT7_003290 [Hymenolepis weldensis]
MFNPKAISKHEGEEEKILLLKGLDSRSTPLTLVRLPNGQLAAVPTSVFGGTQLTLAAPAPPPPLQQPILQSHGTTLVLRYPQQQQQKTGEQQFDPSQGSIVDASTGSATGNAAIALVNGNCQFQQAPQYQQQQRLVMLSSGGKNTCYEHLNDPSSNSVNGSSTTSGGAANSINGNVSSGDQVNSVPETQTQTITTAFQQTSGSVTQSSQLQSAPAGAMAVLVRGANSQSTLQK